MTINESTVIKTSNTDKSNFSSFARVVDVIMDDKKYPKIFNENGGWNSLGAILYKDINEIISEDNPGQLNIAFPLFPNIKNYPLKNEIVILLLLPNYNSQNKTSIVSPYYMSVINLWNSTHHNALPELKGDAGEYIDLENGRTIRRLDDEADIDLGKFKENPKIHPLLPLDGDILYEGRFGHSVRFGNFNGEPTLLISNEHGNKDSKSWVPILEDINKDGASIWMTSNVSVPIELASTNQRSFGINFENNIKSFSIKDVPLNNVSKTEEDTNVQNSNIETPTEELKVHNTVTVSNVDENINSSFMSVEEEEFLMGKEEFVQPEDSISSDLRDIPNNDSYKNNKNNNSVKGYHNLISFNQGDNKWASLKGNGESYTMKTAGCCQSSFAMILNYLVSDTITPGYLFNISGYVLTYWGKIIEHVNNNFNTKLGNLNVKINPTNMLMVDDWLINEGPVLMETKNKTKPTHGYTEYNGVIENSGLNQKPYVAGNQHWMVIVGKNTDGTYDLHDPNGGRIRRNQISEDILKNISRFGFITKIKTS